MPAINEITSLIARKSSSSSSGKVAKKAGKKISKGGIAGIVIAIIVILIVLAIIAFVLYKRKQKKQQQLGGMKMEAPPNEQHAPVSAPAQEYGNTNTGFGQQPMQQGYGYNQPTSGGYAPPAGAPPAQQSGAAAGYYGH